MASTPVSVNDGQNLNKFGFPAYKPSIYRPHFKMLQPTCRGGERLNSYKIFFFGFRSYYNAYLLERKNEMYL